MAKTPLTPSTQPARGAPIQLNALSATLLTRMRVLNGPVFSIVFARFSVYFLLAKC